MNIEELPKDFRFSSECPFNTETGEMTLTDACRKSGQPGIYSFTLKNEVDSDEEFVVFADTNYLSTHNEPLLHIVYPAHHSDEKFLVEFFDLPEDVPYIGMRVALFSDKQASFIVQDVFGLSDMNDKDSIISDSIFVYDGKTFDDTFETISCESTNLESEKKITSECYKIPYTNEAALYTNMLVTPGDGSQAFEISEALPAPFLKATSYKSQSPSVTPTSETSTPWISWKIVSGTIGLLFVIAGSTWYYILRKRKQYCDMQTNRLIQESCNENHSQYTSGQGREMSELPYVSEDNSSILSGGNCENGFDIENQLEDGSSQPDEKLFISIPQQNYNSVNSENNNE